MSDDSPHLRWRILPDEEVRRGEDDAFGIHTAYARFLLQVCLDCPTPFTIGLYSGWGTGKTSIVRLLQELVDRDKSKPISIIYLDVWKYSSDPLKRWILFETERQLGDQRLLKDYKFDGRTLQSHLEFEEQIEERGQIKVDFGALKKLFLAVLLLVGLSLAAWFLIPNGWKSKEILQWLLALVGGGGAVALILTAAFKKLAEQLAGFVFQRSIKQVTAKPAFSSETFARIFHDIVLCCTEAAHKRRLVFVFDNLDRCPADVAVDVIGVVKTFLDEPRCIYVIPCDEEAILAHIRNGLVPASEPDPSDAHANEFLSKFFQMTVRLPPAADFAVDDYLSKELAEAKLEDLTPDAKDVLVLGYRGETPRQVKRVLNDLIAYRGVAERIEAQGLVGKGVLTSDLGHLTKMAVLSVKWPSFVRKLADDPEQWVEVMDRVRLRKNLEMDEVTPDLQQFLWNTRLVSPDADIRPWLYFTRRSIERDGALARRVAETLQNGSWEQFSTLLEDKTFSEKKKQILEMAAVTSRRWMNSHRRLFLRNGGPVLVKAAIAFPDENMLRKEALDVLDYLTSGASADEMEQLFDVKDILSITSHSPGGQRAKFVKPYVEFFETKHRLTPARQEIYRQLIQNGDALEPSDKRLICDVLVDRYSMTEGEGEVLGLLEYAAADPAPRSWIVTSPLLEKVIDATCFDRSDEDQIRRHVLVTFRHVAKPQLRASLLREIAKAIASSEATRPGIQPGVSAISATEILDQLEPELVDAGELKPVAESLLAQAKRSPVAARAIWIKPLVRFYRVLSEKDLLGVDALLESSFVSSDPSEAGELSKDLGEEARRQLLELEGFRVLLREQASSYRGRYAANAAARRGEFLQTFEPNILVAHPDIFDGALSWDLAQFVEAAGRACDEGVISASDAGLRIENFCEKYLPENFGAQPKLYEALVDLLEERPDISNLGLARMVTACEFSKISAEDFSDYSRHSKFKAMLPTEQRLEFARDTSKLLARKIEGWVELLILLVDDVTQDDEVSKNAVLVGDLADLSFSASRDEWTQSADVLTKSVELLDPAQQQEYIDRAMEVLLGLSAGGEDLPQLEPFLGLIGRFPGQVHGTVATKARKFIQRMLGASQSDATKLRALEFAATLDPKVAAPLKPQLEQLAESQETAVGDLAKALLAKF